MNKIEKKPEVFRLDFPEYFVKLTHEKIGDKNRRPNIDFLESIQIFLTDLPDTSSPTNNQMTIRQ